MSLALPGWQTSTLATSTMTRDAERLTVTTQLDAFHDSVRLHALTSAHQFSWDRE